MTTESKDLKPCRDAFEKWMESHGFTGDILKLGSDGAYHYPIVINSWDIWQAAWNTRPQKKVLGQWHEVSKVGYEYYEDNPELEIEGRILYAAPVDVEGLRKALSFYAEPKNWQSPSTGFALQYEREPSPVEKDRGKLASDAIAASPDTLKEGGGMKDSEKVILLGAIVAALAVANVVFFFLIKPGL